MFEKLYAQQKVTSERRLLCTQYLTRRA